MSTTFLPVNFFEENRLWHLLIDSCQERPTLQTLDGVKMVLPFIACMVDVMYALKEIYCVTRELKKESPRKTEENDLSTLHHSKRCPSYFLGCDRLYPFAVFFF